MIRQKSKPKKYLSIVNLEISKDLLKTQISISLDKNNPWVSKFMWEQQESDLRCGAEMAYETVWND